MREVSVIILAYGDEPLLAECVSAVLDSLEVDVEVVLVDNGAASVPDFSSNRRVTILTPETNTGFAGGCNLAVQHATRDELVFVNSDLIVEADAIALLVSRLSHDEVGLATGAVLLPGQPPRINSIGNPVHYLMFSWAGAFGEPFSDHDHTEPIAGVCGGFFACRRAHWNALGGFDDSYFAYAEDVDLSLRTWQLTREVVFEPRARGIHHYQFTKNNHKWYLLERNRLMNLLTLYDRRSTWLLLPVVVPVECGVLFAAWRGGWGREKLDSWRWLWTNRSHLIKRRARITATKAIHRARWTHVLSPEMHIPGEFGLRVPPLVNWALGRYWRVVASLID